MSFVIIKDIPTFLSQNKANVCAGLLNRLLFRLMFVKPVSLYLNIYIYIYDLDMLQKLKMYVGILLPLKVKFEYINIQEMFIKSIKL